MIQILNCSAWNVITKKEAFDYVSNTRERGTQRCEGVVWLEAELVHFDRRLKGLRRAELKKYT